MPAGIFRGGGSGDAQPVERADNSVLVIGAMWMGTTRLIDNMVELIQSRALHQHFKCDDFERSFMRGFQTNRRDDARIESFLPWLDADAPAISRFQAGKSPLRMGSDEIVADGGLMGQERVGNDDANGVASEIVLTRIAFAIAVVTSERIRATGL